MTLTLPIFLEFLETYKGRDKILRTLSYSTKFASGLARSEVVANGFDNFSSQISACRATLRLLDDLPMLLYVIEYGLGHEEKDEYIRYTNILSNVVDLIFYPIDHISWAIDYNILKCNDSRWGTASTACWALSLYLTIAKSMRGLHILSEEKLQLQADKKDWSEIDKLSKKQKALLIAVLRAGADLTYAIHYLPKGFLWSGCLKKWHVGALGTFSSILGLYQSFFL